MGNLTVEEKRERLMMFCKSQSICFMCPLGPEGFGCSRFHNVPRYMSNHEIKVVWHDATVTLGLVLRGRASAMSELSNRLKDLLASHDLSQRQLAKEIGVSNVTIHRIIHGQENVMLDVLDKIADYFEVSIDWLVGREA